MTPAERRQWQALKARQFSGLKVRRQHPVGPYVLDFAVAEILLGIELDGPVHFLQLEEGAARAAILADFGWMLMRFPNEAIAQRLTETLDAIGRACEERRILLAITNDSPAASIDGGPAARLDSPAPRARGEGVGGLTT